MNILPSFYRYIIYRTYSWRLGNKDNTPFTTTELLMCSLHYFQILTLYSIITYFFPKADTNLSKPQVAFIALAFQLVYHLTVYNKKRWSNYIEEFEVESIIERKKRSLIMWIYIVVSISSFFICLPILFG